MRCNDRLEFKFLKSVEVGAFLPSCHYLLNNHPDEVESKAALPTAWLVKLNIPLGSDFLNTLSYDTLTNLLPIRRHQSGGDPRRRGDHVRGREREFLLGHVLSCAVDDDYLMTH